MMIRIMQIACIVLFGLLLVSAGIVGHWRNLAHLVWIPVGLVTAYAAYISTLLFRDGDEWHFRLTRAVWRLCLGGIVRTTITFVVLAVCFGALLFIAYKSYWVSVVGAVVVDGSQVSEGISLTVVPDDVASASFVEDDYFYLKIPRHRIGKKLLVSAQGERFGESEKTEIVVGSDSHFLIQIQSEPIVLVDLAIKHWRGQFSEDNLEFDLIDLLEGQSSAGPTLFDDFVIDGKLSKPVRGAWFTVPPEGEVRSFSFGSAGQSKRIRFPTDSSKLFRCESEGVYAVILVVSEEDVDWENELKGQIQDLGGPPSAVSDALVVKPPIKMRSEAGVLLPEDYFERIRPLIPKSAVAWGVFLRIEERETE